MACYSSNNKIEFILRDACGSTDSHLWETVLGESCIARLFLIRDWVSLASSRTKCDNCTPGVLEYGYNFCSVY